MVARFSKFYGKIWVGFCLNIEKRFFQLIHTNPGYLFQLKYFYGIFFFFLDRNIDGNEKSFLPF